MTTEEILNSNNTKTKKLQLLFELGLTRKQASELMQVRYGFAQNVFAKVYGVCRTNKKNLDGFEQPHDINFKTNTRTFKFPNGNIHTVNTNWDIIKILNENKLPTQQTSPDKYMETAAEILKTEKGLDIRCNNIDIFVQDIILKNYIKSIPNKKKAKRK